MQEFWSGLPSSRGNGANGASTSGRGRDEHIEPRSSLQAPPHDLTFTSVQGDFQARALVKYPHQKLSITLVCHVAHWLCNPCALAEARCSP